MCYTSSLRRDAIQLSPESKQLPCQIAAGNKWINISILTFLEKRLKVKPWKLENLNISELSESQIWYTFQCGQYIHLNEKENSLVLWFFESSEVYLICHQLSEVTADSTDSWFLEIMFPLYNKCVILLQRNMFIQLLEYAIPAAAPPPEPKIRVLWC